MALQVVGTTACPFCNNQAPVGISLEGSGNSVHLICRMCSAQVQAHRYGRVGVMLLEKATKSQSTTADALPGEKKVDPWEGWRPNKSA